MPEATIRPVESDADYELSVAIHNEVLPKRRVTVDEARAWDQALEHTLPLLAYLDDEPAGSSHAGVEAGRSHPFAIAYVLAAHRRKGVGTRLYEATSAWARRIGAEALATSVRADDEQSLAWAQRRGFVEQSRDTRMVLELAGIEAPRADPPAGVEIVTWTERPELTRSMYEVYREVSPDVPGQEDEPLPSFEEWLKQDMSGPSDRPEATFVAIAEGEAVAYAKFHLGAGRPEVAIHDLTGVKRAWRGRGIARALKATQIGWAKERGYARLETMNEERNEPIRRLNAEFGYRPEPGRVLLVGPLSAGTT